jgi:hypothetical protein
MVLKDILAISGHNGLFKYVSKGRNNVIVENLVDRKRITILPTARISMLGDITIFTKDRDVPLREVLIKIKDRENGGEAIPHKSPDAELKKYFEEVFPEYDKNRVYVSDIRKIVLWYNILLELGFTDFGEPEETKEGELSDEQAPEEKLPEEKAPEEKATEEES